MDRSGATTEPTVHRNLHLFLAQSLWFADVLWRLLKMCRGSEKLHLCLSGPLTVLSYPIMEAPPVITALLLFHPFLLYIYGSPFRFLQQTHNFPSLLSQQSCLASLQSTPASLVVPPVDRQMNEMASVSRSLDAVHTITRTHKKPRKSEALKRNNLKWEAHKDEIRNLYIDRDMTLKATIAWFERKHDFVKRQASSPVNIEECSDKE